MVRRATALPALFSADVRTQYQLSRPGLGGGTRFDERTRPVDQTTLLSLLRRQIRASEVAAMAAPMVPWIDKLDRAAQRATRHHRRGWRRWVPFGALRGWRAQRRLHRRIRRSDREGSWEALQEAMAEAARLPTAEQTWADWVEHRDELLATLRSIVGAPASVDRP
jgi:hypothetical protein